MPGIHETSPNTVGAAEPRPAGEAGARAAVSVHERENGLRFRRFVDQMSRKDRESREAAEGGARPETGDPAGFPSGDASRAESGLAMPTACCIETDAHLGGGGLVVNLIPQVACPPAQPAPTAEMRAAVESRMERVESALRLSAYAEANTVPNRLEIPLDREVLPGSLIRIVQDAGQVRVQVVVPGDADRARTEAVLQGLSRQLDTHGLTRTRLELSVNATGRDATDVIVSKAEDGGIGREVVDPISGDEDDWKPKHDSRA